MDSFHRNTELQPERVRPRAELVCRREREVHLQADVEQEHPVDPGADVHVKVMDHAVFSVHALRPIRDRGRHCASVANPEGKVDIRPLVLRAARRRSGYRGAADARVLTGSRNQGGAQGLALITRVHA